MEGVEGGSEGEGVIPRAFQHIFAKIAAGQRPFYQAEWPEHSELKTLSMECLTESAGVGCLEPVCWGHIWVL